MSSNDRRTNPFDPTEEAAVDQSTQAAGGLTAGQTLPSDEEIIGRDRKSRGTTPRRYEEETADPVVSSDESRRKTKI
jgi:hypothetical protein